MGKKKLNIRQAGDPAPAPADQFSNFYKNDLRTLQRGPEPPPGVFPLISTILSFLFISIFLTACTSSFFTMPATMMLASATKVEAVKKKRYNLLDECMFDERPSPVDLGDTIAYGDPLTAKYSKIMEHFTLTAADGKVRYDDPIPPHYLAYALYNIGDRVGDMRGKPKMQWIGPYISERERKRIQDYMDGKYLNTYLRKCYFVPREYKMSPTYTDIMRPY